jgi:2-iminobutanoate/2-iminopropanoate deaminase
MIELVNPAGMESMGAYSQAVKINLGMNKSLILVAGQLAVDKDGNAAAPNDIETQTRIVFGNIKTVLKEAGASLDDVVKAQIFLTDMDQYAKVSEIRNEYFATNRPVSTLVEINRTVIDGCDIEIEVMAITEGN